MLYSLTANQSVKHKEEFSMNCPRCGSPMSGGICNNCGFPVNRVNNGITVSAHKQAHLKHAG